MSLKSGLTLFLTLALWPLPSSTPAQQSRGDDAPRRILRTEITADLRFSVKRGFRYLVSEQTSSGAYSRTFPVAVNALVGLAFLSAGYTGEVGPHTAAFNLGVDKLLSYQKVGTGYFDDGQSVMYGHGFATLFLAELYGMSGKKDEKIHQALKRAVQLIEKSQCANGGWDYQPGMPDGDTSITVCQTMALRAARNLGISVSSQVISRAKKFILSAQNKSNGGFAYRLGKYNRFARQSMFPRSAAGVCVLLSLGDYRSEAVQKGFQYLMRKYKVLNTFPYYADYYCTLAMFQAGGRYWREYFPYIRAKLLKKQLSNGSWKGGIGGPGQSTAMALIALQVPYRYLPISER